MVCIIDDREDVWSYAPNLVAVKPYLFFKDTGDINAPPTSQEAAENARWTRAGGRTAEESLPTRCGGAETEGATAGQWGSSKGSAERPDAEQPVDREHGDQDVPETCVSPEDTPGTPKDDSKVVEEEDDSSKEPGQVSSSREGPSERTPGKATVDDNGSGAVAESAVETGKLGELSDCDGGTVGEAGDLPTGVGSVECEEKLANEAKDDHPPQSSESGDGKEARDDGECGEEHKGGAGEPETVAEKSSEGTTCDAEAEPVLKSGQETSGDPELEPVTKSGEKDKAERENATCEAPKDDEEKAPGDVELKLVVEKSGEEKPGDAGEKDRAKRESMEDNGLAATPEEEEEKPLKEREVVEDSDDYLLYLEEILRTIHEAYYALHDQMGSSRADRIPDLKHVVPYVRRKVLKGSHLVFSGVVPTNQEPEKSRAWQTARALGARVSSDLCPGVTHLVAARPGTAKVNRARRTRQLHVVSPAWLWCCAERWEHVHEALFPLEAEAPAEARRAQRLPSTAATTRAAEPRREEAAAADPTREAAAPVYDAVTGKRIWRNGPQQQRDVAEAGPVAPLREQSNPHLSMSSDQLRDMDREVDDACSEGDEDDEGEGDARPGDSDSSAESLSGGHCPRGWRKRRRKGAEDDDDDEPAAKSARCWPAEDSDRGSRADDDSSEAESVGSVDEEMAAAVEREFLGL
ncbi:RNA polymerase II subunit A C-terminal domain phosphatase [Ixodes scapularis]